MEIKQITLTPEKAKMLLKKQGRNRNVSNPVISRLSAAIRQGEWKINNDAICIDTNGCMINGQHRCKAVVATGTEIPVLFAQGYDPNNIFVMDNAIKTRSAGDALTLNGVKYGNNIAGMLGVLKTYIEAVYIGTAVRSTMSPQAALVEYEKYKDEINTSVKFIDKRLKASGMRILKGSIGGFCHLAFSMVDKDCASNFMESLICGSLLSDDSPVLQMRNKLIRNKVTLAKISGRDILALIIKSWNMEYGTRSAKNLTWTPARDKFPIIYGEPFKGMYSPERLLGQEVLNNF